VVTRSEVLSQCRPGEEERQEDTEDGDERSELRERNPDSGLLHAAPPWVTPSANADNAVPRAYRQNGRESTGTRMPIDLTIGRSQGPG